MQRAFLVSACVLVLVCSQSAAPPPVFISPQHCPRGAGVSQDPFYDVTAIQDRLIERGHSKALVVQGRYRAIENSGTWVLHPVRYEAQSHRLELELRRNAGPPIRNPPCVSFSGSFTNGNPLEVTIRDSSGRRIRVDVHRPAGAAPRA